jgi:hypothetical protein
LIPLRPDEQETLTSILVFWIKAKGATLHRKCEVLSIAAKLALAPSLGTEQMWLQVVREVCSRVPNDRTDEALAGELAQRVAGAGLSESIRRPATAAGPGTQGPGGAP